MLDINSEYTELKQQSNNVSNSIKELQDQIHQHLLKFIQNKNYRHYQQIYLKNDHNLLYIEFCKKDDRLGRDVTLYLSIPKDFLYSGYSDLNENNFDIETEINYCSTIVTGNENVALQSDFFIQTYSIINELNNILKDKNSGLFNLLKEFYFVNRKLNESLYEIHSKMRQLKKEKKEQVIQKVFSSLAYQKPEQQDILDLLNNGSKITLIQPSINIDEDSLFSDLPQYTVDIIEGKVYKSERTYYIEGQEFIKRFDSKLNKSQFLDMLSKVMI